MPTAVYDDSLRHDKMESGYKRIIYMYYCIYLLKETLQSDKELPVVLFDGKHDVRQPWVDSQRRQAILPNVTIIESIIVMYIINARIDTVKYTAESTKPLCRRRRRLQNVPGGRTAISPPLVRKQRHTCGIFLF